MTLLWVSLLAISIVCLVIRGFVKHRVGEIPYAFIQTIGDSCFLIAIFCLFQDYGNIFALITLCAMFMALLAYGFTRGKRAEPASNKLYR